MMVKAKARLIPKIGEIFCNPDVCPNCQYIGEGDSICEVTQEIVLEDWEPTEDFMGHGCPYAKKIRKRGRRK